MQQRGAAPRQVLLRLPAQQRAAAPWQVLQVLLVPQVQVLLVQLRAELRRRRLQA